MVSDLAELRKTLRKSDESNDSTFGSALSQAICNAHSRIECELASAGQSEVTDDRGNRFIIERRRA